MDRPSCKRMWISDMELDFIRKTKDKCNLPTDKAALSYIIADYIKMKNKQSFVRSELEDILNQKLEELQPLLERIKWASSEAERNSIMILDGLNAQFVYEGMLGDCLVEEAEAEVISKSKTRIKEKISHFKQKKDERIAKRGKNKICKIADGSQNESNLQNCRRKSK